MYRYDGALALQPPPSGRACQVEEATCTCLEAGEPQSWAALQATRVRDWGDKGHVGQEDRASKPQGLGGDFILRKVGRHRGLWSMELGVWFILVVSFRIA